MSLLIVNMSTGRASRASHLLTNGIHLMTSLIKIFHKIEPVWWQRYYAYPGSSRQGVGTVHASSNFAASHHYES